MKAGCRWWSKNDVMMLLQFPIFMIKGTMELLVLHLKYKMFMHPFSILAKLSQLFRLEKSRSFQAKWLHLFKPSSMERSCC
jgi:hypothetical protein